MKHYALREEAWAPAFRRRGRKSGTVKWILIRDDLRPRRDYCVRGAAALRARAASADTKQLFWFDAGDALRRATLLEREAEALTREIAEPTPMPASVEL
jgi:hypothetical protein